MSGGHSFFKNGVLVASASSVIVIGGGIVKDVVVQNYLTREFTDSVWAATIQILSISSIPNWLVLVLNAFVVILILSQVKLQKQLTMKKSEAPHPVPPSSHDPQNVRLALENLHLEEEQRIAMQTVASFHEANRMLQATSHSIGRQANWSVLVMEQALGSLEQKGLIESRQAILGTVYQLTEAGREWVLLHRVRD